MCHNACVELKDPLFLLFLFVLLIAVLTSAVSFPQIEKPLRELSGGRSFSRQNALPPMGRCGSKSRLVDIAGGSLVTITGSLSQAAARRSCREMEIQPRKEEPALSKMRAVALRLQHKGNALSPGAARGEQMC